MSTPSQPPAVIQKDTALSNEKKVAIFIASLPENTAAMILQRLPPASLRVITRAIQTLGVIPRDVRERVITECMKGITDSQGSITGDEQTANKLLMQAIGEKRAAALLQEEQDGNSLFSGLEDVGSEQLLTILGREQPSVIATVLRFLDSTLASEILNELPPEISKRVMVIICTGRSPSEAVIKRVHAYIESKIGKRKKSEMIDVGDQIDRASAILQLLDHDLTEDVLQTIDESAPDLGTELRDRLFKFDDIIRLSDADMRRIMQEISMDSLAVALRTAPIDVREKFFNNMSRRASQGIKEDMEFSAKVKLSDIELKQKEIIGIIRDLDGQGEISLQEGASNEYV